MSQMRDEPRVARVERVGVLVVAGGPVGIVSGAHRLTGFGARDEPVGVIAHEARIASGEKRRGPDSGHEAGVANFSRELFQPARELRIGRVPIAERRLKAVIELNYVERKLRTHRLERVEVGAHRIFGDGVKVVVPGTPSALVRRRDPRAHPSARCVGPSRGQARGGLIGGGDKQWIDFAIRARWEDYVIEDRARNYFFGVRDGERRKRSRGTDESGQDALGRSAAFDDREKFRGLRLGEFGRPSSFALMIDARDEIGGVARMGLRPAYIVTARRAP